MGFVFISNRATCRIWVRELDGFGTFLNPNRLNKSISLLVLCVENLVSVRQDFSSSHSTTLKLSTKEDISISSGRTNWPTFVFQDRVIMNFGSLRYNFAFTIQYSMTVLSLSKTKFSYFAQDLNTSIVMMSSSSSSRNRSSSSSIRFIRLERKSSSFITRSQQGHKHQLEIIVRSGNVSDMWKIPFPDNILLVQLYCHVTQLYYSIIHCMYVHY